MERGRGEIFRERERERESYPSLPPSISPITLYSIISPSLFFRLLSHTHSLFLSLFISLSIPIPQYKPLSIYLPHFPSLSLSYDFPLSLPKFLYLTHPLSLLRLPIPLSQNFSLYINISLSLSLYLLFSLRRISLSSSSS
jgi:hypothetical protein